MKTLSFPLVTPLLTLAAIETMALFSDRLLHSEPAHSFEANAPGPRWAAPTAKAVLHPFYGHVPRDSGTADNRRTHRNVAGNSGIFCVGALAPVARGAFDVYRLGTGEPLSPRQLGI